MQDDCSLQLNWVMEDKQKEERYQRADVLRIRLLPLHTIKWDLPNLEKRVVSREFLLGSLAAWSKAREGTVLARADSLRRSATGSSDEHRLELCYEDLFRGKTRISIVPTQRTYPFEQETKVGVPSEILEKGEAEPLEAALLMAAIVRASTPSGRVNLELFLVPTESKPRDPEVLLAWLSGSTWKAIDLREAGTLSFDSNQRQSSDMLKQLFLREPHLVESLERSGVVAASGPLSSTAVSFDEAAEQFEIRPLD